MNNGLPSVPACPMVHAPLETENATSEPSKNPTSMIVYGIDVYDNDIATLAPGKMVNDTIVNILFE